MSKFSVYVIRFIIIVISITLTINLIITYIDKTRSEFKESTSVGNVYLGGLPKKSISQYIEPKVSNYINELEIKYTFNNQTYIDEVNFIEYDDQLTLDTIVDGSSSNFSFTINTNKLKLLLSRKLPKYIFNNIDYDTLNTDLDNYYTSLKTKAEIYINDYIIDFDSLKEELNTYTYFLDNPVELLEEINDVDIIIEPNSRFSVLETFKFEHLSTTELNILATGINAVTIESNFTSYIKSNSRIPYSKVNRDIEMIETSINKTQNKDFSFYNPYDYSYQVKVKKTDSGLQFSLIGIPFDEDYKFMIEEEVIPYIPLSEDTKIPTGSKLISGVDGKEIQVYRYIDVDNEIKNKVLLYTNYFGPRNESYVK